MTIFKPQGDSSKKQQWLLLSGIFLLFFALGLLFPYVHDDWAWGTSTGLDRLHRFFSDYNGRYASNMLALLLTRSRLIRALTYGACFSSITWFSFRLSGGKKPIHLLFVLLFVLLVPSAIFAQAISWTSGFVNYTASAAILLPLLFFIKGKITDEQPVKTRWVHILLLSCACLIGQLFVEHVTLYTLLALLMANALFFRRHKRMDTALFCLLIAALAGTAIMFSNGAYLSALSGENTYQQFHTGGLLSRLRGMAGAYFTKIYRYTLLDCLPLSLSLGGLTMSLLIKNKPRLWRIPCLISAALIAYQLVRKCLPFSNPIGNYALLLEGLLCFLFLLSLFYTLWAISDLRFDGLCLLGSAVLLIAPLFVVSPIGPRNFFVVYLFLTMLCARMALAAAPLTARSFRKPFKKICAVLCALLTLSYLTIFSVVAYQDHSRLQSVREQVGRGETEIELERLPFEEYMHNSSPVSDRCAIRFVRFYGLPENIQIVVENAS